MIQTIALSKLPVPSSITGRARVYDDADVAAAVAAITKGLAVTNGKTYPTKRAAHNAVSTLRTRVKKAAPALTVAAQIVAETTTAADAPTLYRFWLRPAAAK